MAIAPSKLGRVIAECMYSGGNALVYRLRQDDLVRADASNENLIAALDKALEEHAAIAEGVRAFNSPNERVRVFLEPYLNTKGKRWAVPLESLKIPDGEPELGERGPWWRSWWARLRR